MLVGNLRVDVDRKNFVVVLIREGVLDALILEPWLRSLSTMLQNFTDGIQDQLEIVDVGVSVNKIIEDEPTTTRLRRSEIVNVGVSMVGITDDDPTTTRR